LLVAAVEGVHHVVHTAAAAVVPAVIENPILTLFQDLILLHH
jgi:hypothetical protein